MVRSPIITWLIFLWFSCVAGCGSSVPYSGYEAKSADRSALPESAPGTISPQPAEGRGPGQGGDRYDLIVENDFLNAAQEPLSTFSIDVDTASYAKTRMFLLQQNMLPPVDAVRIEELVNYFAYEYAPPTGNQPFSANVEVADCPWQPAHQLARIGIQGRQVDQGARPASNLVFLLDVSGSMSQANKLPLLKRGMKLLVDQLNENDRVAIVVYAGAAGLVLPSTTGDRKQVILDSLSRLNAGGSTNGGAGIQLAYQTALDNFIPGGTNRVILCSDGDFNVGTTSDGELIRLVESNAQHNIFLTVLGFGIGNHNDAMLEQISNRGNGNYAFVDSDLEARKVLVDQLSGTLVTIAKDVKIQVEFNPARVAEYRLIGYENRLLAARDFNDDRKDAGEIGAGHRVTALYELVPADSAGRDASAAVDPLKYQQPTELSPAAQSGELMTIKIRYKEPEATTSELLTFAIQDEARSFAATSPDFKLAAAVASFGMLLRNSAYKGDASYDAVLEIGGQGALVDPNGYRQEFLHMVRQARLLADTSSRR
jgi:Ca-activated chloride channel family protein